MGFQTSHTTKRITQPIYKAKEDASDTSERSLIRRVLNFTDHTLSNTNFFPSGYDSWMVSSKYQPSKLDGQTLGYIFISKTKTGAFVAYELNYSEAGIKKIKKTTCHVIYT